MDVMRSSIPWWDWRAYVLDWALDRPSSISIEPLGLSKQRHWLHLSTVGKLSLWMAHLHSYFACQGLASASLTCSSECVWQLICTDHPRAVCVKLLIHTLCRERDTDRKKNSFIKHISFKLFRDGDENYSVSVLCSTTNKLSLIFCPLYNLMLNYFINKDQKSLHT